MTSTSKDRARVRRRLTSAAVVAALAVLATATSTTASTPPGSDETTTTAPAQTTTAPAETTTPDGTAPSTDDATSTSAAATTTAGSATTTAPPTGFAAVLAEQCEGDTGQQLLASGLQVVMGDDGSLRIVEIVLTCDIEFVGAVDPELGRPSTNVEALIADPANNVTPNQAQTDLLNEELATYWRITDAWVTSQAGAPATTTTVASEPSATAEVASSAPAELVTSVPEESATTGG
jgi:hypothetical protein